MDKMKLVQFSTIELHIDKSKLQEFFCEPAKSECVFVFRPLHRARLSYWCRIAAVVNYICFHESYGG